MCIVVCFLARDSALHLKKLVNTIDVGILFAFILVVLRKSFLASKVVEGTGEIAISREEIETQIAERLCCMRSMSTILVATSEGLTTFTSKHFL